MNRQISAISMYFIVFYFITPSESTVSRYGTLFKICGYTK